MAYIKGMSMDVNINIRNNTEFYSGYKRYKRCGLM